VEAVLDVMRRMRQRPIEARLTGWPYQPYAGYVDKSHDEKFVARGTEPVPLNGQATGETPADLHLTGLANLLAKRDDVAVDQLVRAAERTKNNPEYWSDVAAARIARAQHNDDASELADALAAADHALRLDEHLSAAAFNRGLILQLLHLDEPAAKQYSLMRDDEPVSGWSVEEAQRIAALQRVRRSDVWSRSERRLATAAEADDTAEVDRIVRAFRQEARTTAELIVMNDWAMAVLKRDGNAAAGALTLARQIGDSLIRMGGDGLLRDAVRAVDDAAADEKRTRMIAQGQRAYYDGRGAYFHRQVTRSIPLFESAVSLFAQGGSPMQGVAAYYVASAHFDANETRRAEAELQVLAAKAPPEYRALKAQIAWELCTLNGNLGSPRTELKFCQASLRGFQELDEFSNAATMRTSVAAVLGRLGLESDAWRLRRLAFASTGESGDTDRLQFALSGAAEEALTSQRWEVARSIFTVALEIPDPNVRRRVSAFLGRAVATWRCGDNAAKDLDDAARTIDTITDKALYASASADLALAKASILARTDPQTAVELADTFIRFAKARQKTLNLPFALLQRARGLRAMGSEDEAVADLRQAVDLIEQRRATVADDDQRDSFLGAHDEPFEALTDILDRRGDVAGTFEMTERGRARMLLERLSCTGGHALTQPLDESEVRRRLAPGILLIAFTSLPDRVLAFALTRDGLRVIHEPISRDYLVALRRGLIDSIYAGDIETFKRRGALLDESLLQPLEPEIASAKTLAIVTDDVTAAIPFAALFDSARSQYVVQRLPILYAPSASSFALGSAARLAVSAPPFRALIVGDPKLTRSAPSAFSELPDLPAARIEADDVARVYGASAITGSAATLTRFTAEAPAADVVHLATHAHACLFDPAQSALALTDEGTGDALTALHIATLKLVRHPVVVLAGCRTAARADRGGTTRSLAMAFLAAGSRDVVGTLWNVDDDAAREISVRFHRELARGTAPAEALRVAQLDLLRSNDPSLFRAWTAFQLWGTHL
jgi:CHAT domain-containing protein/tetratricopeptide (TPR) repeat protein